MPKHDTEVTHNMARPRHEQPTPAELEILKVLWDRDGPSSVRDVLDAVNRGLEVDLETGLEIEARNFAKATLSDDAVIGIMSFLSKQEPEFTGK